MPLGDLYRKGLVKARRVRRKLRTIADNSPVKLDLKAASNLLGAAARDLRQKVVWFLPGGGRLALPGAQESEAWDAGHHTYAQLMEWVKVKTGKGCSHANVSLLPIAAGVSRLG